MTLDQAIDKLCGDLGYKQRAEGETRAAIRRVLNAIANAGIVTFDAPPPILRTIWLEAVETSHRVPPGSVTMKARVTIDEVIRGLNAAGYRVTRA